MTDPMDASASTETTENEPRRLLMIDPGTITSDQILEHLKEMKDDDRRAVILEMLVGCINAMDYVTLDNPADVSRLVFVATATALAVGSKGSRIARVVSPEAGLVVHDKGISAYRLLEAAGMDFRRHIRSLESVINPTKDPEFNTTEFILKRRIALKQEEQFQEQLKKAAESR